MKKFLFCLILTTAFLFPITTNALTAKTTDGVIVVTWEWTYTPGVYPGGFWKPIAIEPYMW